MAIFVTMKPPGGEEENTVFVRDGFHVLAFLLPFFWFLWHRMWIEAAVTAAVLVLLGVADAANGIAGTLLSLLFALAAGLEAPSLRLWALRRRGWRENGVAEGETAGDAELRYFMAQEGDEDTRAAAAPAHGGAGRDITPALGLLGQRVRHP